MTPAAAALPQQEQGRKRSKSSPSVLESTSPTPPIPADFREHGVCFQERPEIILFLSDPNEGRAVSLPPIRPLAPIAEEVENDLPVGLNGSISMLSTIPYVGGTPLPAGEAKANAKSSRFVRGRSVGPKCRQTSHHAPEPLPCKSTVVRSTIDMPMAGKSDHTPQQESEREIRSDQFS